MPQPYRLAIFDFDGTLADSFPFFARVCNTLAEQHGFRTVDAEMAEKFRHCDARQIMRQLGVPMWKLPIVARSFIALLQQNLSSVQKFEHVDDTLLHLSQCGIKLAVVSSNSYDNVAAILGPTIVARIEHFQCGMSIFGKAKRIVRALRATGVAGHEAIYIGDQITDLEAARAAKVDFGAVAWGYAAIEALRRHAPEMEFDRVEAIKLLAAPLAAPPAS